MVDRVLRILERDWQDPLRCTNVEQAMARAGMRFAESARRQVAQVLLHNPRFGELMRWHPSAYLLRNEERLVARSTLRFLHGETEEERLIQKVAQHLRMPEEAVRGSVEALVWVRFLERDGLRLRLSPQAPEFLEGIGFFFHEVVAGVERFNVNCFHDFVLLTSPAWRERRRQESTLPPARRPGMTAKMVAFLERLDPEALFRRSYERGVVTLYDACAQCIHRIRLMVWDGRLADEEPQGTWHVRGGGCGVNLLLCCEGCVEAWMSAHPQFLQAERGPASSLWQAR